MGQQISTKNKKIIIFIPKFKCLIFFLIQIHAAILPSEKRNDPNKIRYAVYVCMMPKKDVS